MMKSISSKFESNSAPNSEPAVYPVSQINLAKINLAKWSSIIIFSVFFSNTYPAITKYFQTKTNKTAKYPVERNHFSN